MTAEGNVEQMRASGRLGPAPLEDKLPHCPAKASPWADLMAAVGSPADTTATEAAAEAVSLLAEKSRLIAALKGEVEQLKADLDACHQMESEGGPASTLAEDALKAAERRAEMAELHNDEMEGIWRPILEEIKKAVLKLKPATIDCGNRGQFLVYQVQLPKEACEKVAFVYGGTPPAR